MHTPQCRVCDRESGHCTGAARTVPNDIPGVKGDLLVNTHIKTTVDGRKVEVIGAIVCLEGRPEADCLVPVIEHPNWRAILQAAPDATHMAGRLPLTVDEAQKAQLAMNAAHAAFDASPAAVAERSRLAINGMLLKRAEE